MPEPLGPSPDPAEPAPRTYLVWALAATVLCFLPLGLVALYYGLRVNRAVAEGRLADARHDSVIARGWLWATIVIGLLVWAFLAAAFALLGAFSD